MKKSIFLVFIIIVVLLFNSISVLAYDKEVMPQMVKIGLMYGQKSTSLVNLHSRSGFEIGYYDGYNEFQLLLNFMNNEDIILRKDSYFMNLNNSYIEAYPSDNNLNNDNLQGPYHVEIDLEFSNRDDALEYIDDFDPSNDMMLYPVFKNGWKVWIGLFTSESKGKEFINTYGDYFGGGLNVVQPNNNLVQVLDNSGRVILIYDSSYGDISFRSFLEKDSNNIIDVNGKSFRGEIIAKRYTDSDLTIINYVNMQEYLYGVLPKEMSGDWPLEALKAQAVAARNFAIANINKHGSYGFDLCDTTDCQVYGGYDVENPRSNRAVDETLGKILTYDGKIISAFFHSNSGGHTEDSENIWSISLPYVRGVEDEFSIGAPNSNWTLALTPLEVKSILQSNNIEIGDVLDMYPEDYSDNGRVLSLVIEGSRDKITLQKEKTRSIFGYNNIKSMWFDIETNGSIYVKYGEDKGTTKMSLNNIYVLSEENMTNATQGSNFSIFNGSDYGAISRSSDRFVLNGKGWGHGLGMSQWGAKKMAETGYTYEEILKHYYKGTILE